jgi:hypothetical protein
LRTGGGLPEPEWFKPVLSLGLVHANIAAFAPLSFATVELLPTDVPAAAILIDAIDLIVDVREISVPSPADELVLPTVGDSAFNRLSISTRLLSCRLDTGKRKFQPHLLTLHWHMHLELTSM